MKALKILVIDDRMTDIEVIRAMLHKQGHSVMTAANGYEGVQLAASEQPDLVLMDVVMPQLNGFQATREMAGNEVTRNIPVIVVSCKSEEVDRIWALKQGARAYLNKGFSREALFRVISEVMEEANVRKDGKQVAIC